MATLRIPPDGRCVLGLSFTIELERFSQDAPAIFRLQKPFGYNHAVAALEERTKRAERGLAQPIRMANECSMCRDCETECPTEAFDADTGLSDPERCIECMHCVYICPDDVVKVDAHMKDGYEGFLTYCHLTEGMMNAQKSKIITEAWQTAF